MDKNASSKTPISRRVFFIQKSVHEASTRKELVSSRETGEQTTTLLRIIPRQRASVSGNSGAAMAFVGCVAFQTHPEPCVWKAKHAWCDGGTEKFPLRRGAVKKLVLRRERTPFRSS